MRIVLIDDSKSSLAFLHSLLKDNIPEAESLAFSDPKEALDWCLSEDKDLVIIDYLMQEFDGLKFILALRESDRNKGIPIVMVTTSEDRDVRYKAFQLGATDFLTKPIDPIEFVARVRNLVELHRTHKALTDRADWLRDEVIKATAEIRDRERETIYAIARAAEYKDPEARTHLVRMSHYARLLAEALGMSEEDCDLIFDAAPMHDIGKIGIPDRILLKPGPLDDLEMAIMKQHAEHGAEILAESRSKLLHMAADIALSHHERFDGTGYPAGRKGAEIPLVGRIVGLVDVFDALVSVRPYKEAWKPEDARAYIASQRGAQFDPEVVDAFLAHWDEILEIIRTIGLDDAENEKLRDHFA